MTAHRNTDENPSIFGVASGILKNAWGRISASQSGNKGTTQGPAWPERILDRATGALVDVRGRPLQVRAISLQASAGAAQACTVVASYPTNVQREWPGRFAVTRREMALGIEFGNGNSTSYLELDVAEGSVVTIPTQTVEVALIDYSLDPTRPPPPEPPPPPPVPYWNIETHAAAAYLQTHKPGVKTMRAYAFFEAPISPAGGPSLVASLVTTADLLIRAPQTRSTTPDTVSTPPDTFTLSLGGLSFQPGDVVSLFAFAPLLDPPISTPWPIVNSTFVSSTEFTVDLDVAQSSGPGLYIFAVTRDLLVDYGGVWTLQ